MNDPSKWGAAAEVLAAPQLSSVDELSPYLGAVHEGGSHIADHLRELADYLKRANVDRSVWEMVEEAAHHAAEMSAHLSTASENAHDRYGAIEFPDFAKVS